MLFDSLVAVRDPSEAGLDLEAVTVVADISGFTALSSDLASRGEAGAEELSQLLNRSIGGLVDLVRLFGGDVVKFAGDAFVAIWPVEREDRARPLRLAAAFASSIPVPATRPENTPPGAPELRIRVGLAIGRVRLTPVGGEHGRWDLLVAGEAVAAAARLQGQAPPGGTALSSEARAILGEEIVADTLPSGSALLLDLRRAPATAPSRPRPPEPGLAEILRPFVPSAILRRIDAGLSAWVAELRPVTVVFVRLPGLSVEAPPPTPVLQGLARAVQICLARVEGVLDKFGVDEKGLTVLAGLGLPPFAHEDDALRGVRAALAMRDALAAEGQPATVGVATGWVFCGTLGSPSRWEYTMLGDVVNRAARLMQRAGLGEVLCDDATRAAIGNRVTWEALASLEAKGMAPLAAYRPLGLLGGASSGQWREALFGREAERAALDRGLDRLVETGHGQVVVVRGEAGIGKSRLLADLRSRAEARGLRVIAASGDAIERLTPYHAWRPVYTRILGISGRATREAARARLPELLGPVSAPLAPLLNVVAPLGLAESPAVLALNPEARADRTRALLTTLLATTAAETPPLVLILDEAHWFDSASWSLLETVAAGVPWVHLVVATRPPEGERAAQLQRLLALPRVERMDLGPLDPEAQGELAAAVLDMPAVPPGVARMLARRAQGNPFYTVELALALRASWSRKSGHGSTFQTLEPSLLPTSVEGALASRIDRLSPEVQVAIKVASVFGRPFTNADLMAAHPVRPTPEAMSVILEGLATANLLVNLPGTDQWAFGSALVRDAAYALMTFSQRRALHGAIARRLEEQRAGGAPVDLPVLAFHWTRAEVVDRAVAALDAAGEEASRQYALEEMNRFFRKALELAPDAPLEQRRRWLLRLGLSRLRMGLPGEAREHLHAALDLRGMRPPATNKALVLPLLREVARQVRCRLFSRGAAVVSSDAEALTESRLWLELCWAEYFRMEPLPSLYAALRAANAAEGLGPSYERTVAYASLSAFSTLAGSRWLSRAWGRLAEEGVAATSDPAAGGVALGVLGAAALARARWDEARRLVTEARTLDQTAGLFEDRDLGALLLCQVALAQGDLEEAARHAEEAREGGERRGSPMLRIRSRFFLGSVALAAGDPARAAALLRESAIVAGGARVDTSSALSARAGKALAEILTDDLDGGAATLLPLVDDPKLAVAASAPASRLAEIAGLAFLELWERAPTSGPWRDAALHLLGTVRKRSRVVLLHAPLAARLWGRALWLDGKKKEAVAVWTEGRGAAEKLGMPVERERIGAVLARGG